MMLQAAGILLQAVVIGLLIRIAIVDFKIQKIGNRDVLALAGVGLAALVIEAYRRLDLLQVDVWWNVYVSMIAAAVLFIALLPFWFLRKVGAGDVKLMAAAPLVAGGEYMLPFSILLMLFALITALFVKNPMLLPAPLFRQYLEYFERKGVVPFGVPIAGALLGVEVLRALAIRMGVMGGF
jgi:prepilin peptidase CpaA